MEAQELKGEAMSNVRFTQPPVREVSLTVLWDPLEGLLAADVGSLLSRLRDKYPRISERPAMPPWVDISRFPSIRVLADNEVLPYSWWLADEANNMLVRRWVLSCSRNSAISA